MVVQIPERSHTQRREALEKANTVRMQRALLKKNIKAGRVNIGEIIQKPPDFVKTMRLFDLLISIRAYGRVKVNKILTQTRISPSKTIGGLSERQRQEIIMILYQR